jgi:chromosome segregation protein
VRSQRPLGSLLDGVYAASSLAEALAVRAALGPGESVITRDGLWIGRDWIKCDRGDDVEHGVLERGHRIEALRERVEQAESHLGELHGRLGEGRARVESLDRDRESLSGRIGALGQKLAQLRADHGVHRVRQEEADARRERLDRERGDLDVQIREENDRLTEARAQLADAERLRESFEAERRRHAGDRERNLASVDEARRSARADRDAFHELNVAKEAILSRLSATETARGRLLRQQQELESRRQTLVDGVEQSRAPLPDLQRDLEGRLADRLAVEHKLADVRASLEATDERLRDLEKQRGERAAGVDAVRAELETARVDRQGQTVQRGTFLEQIRATGLALDEIRARLPETAAETEWAAELERIGNRIQRLGPINLAAIEEHQSAAERKQYLDAQHADLTEALTTLTNAIRRIDRETRQRFKDTFEAVNERLAQLFPKVFGGGHAYLELTGEDLLDTGVTLMARPPGKRNASVHLLSGGEKALTAVALIFAIFQLNPSPVCLLDEVDAPLDDSNVVRFANLISEMSADVQFIVITHNKLTMEMADQLMGVTMNEPGVSRLVSVDVEEAARMAAV